MELEKNFTKKIRWTFVARYNAISGIKYLNNKKSSLRIKQNSLKEKKINISKELKLIQKLSFKNTKKSNSIFFWDLQTKNLKKIST